VVGATGAAGAAASTRKLEAASHELEAGGANHASLAKEALGPVPSVAGSDPSARAARLDVVFVVK
jgi:hypothetical protein